MKFRRRNSLVGVLLIFSLTACNNVRDDTFANSTGKHNEEIITITENKINVSIEEVEKLPATVEECLANLYITDIEDMDDMGATLEAAIVSCGSYEIISQTNENCEIKVIAPNVKKLLVEVVEEFGNEPENVEKIEKAVIGRLLKDDFDTVSTVVTVGVDYSRGYMRLVYTEEFANAMYGGLLEYYNELIQ